jgi:hypothetical protein
VFVQLAESLAATVIFDTIRKSVAVIVMFPRDFPKHVSRKHEYSLM